MNGPVLRLVRATAAATVFAGTLGVAAATQFAVVVEPSAVTTTLNDHHLVLDRTAWTIPGRATVIVASSAAPLATVADAYDLVDALLQPPSAVFGAGVILHDSPDRIAFYAGKVLVRFSVPTGEARAQAWAAGHGFTYLGYAGEEDTYLMRVAIETSTLMARAGRPRSLGSVAAFTPVIHEVVAPGTHQPDPGGLYHRYPAGRNLLAVELIPGLSRVVYDARVSATGGSLVKTAVETVEVLEFSNEAAMLTAQKEFRGLAEVRRTGPVVNLEPLLIFLTDQLVVQYPNLLARLQAQVTLSIFGLDEQRRLPYAARTFVLIHPEPSYVLYDAADELVRQGLTHFAVPNLFRESPDACEDPCDLTPAHHEYLEDMNVCGVWELPSEPPESVVLGILDQGLNTAWTAADVCNRLEVGSAIDFDSMETCEPVGGDVCRACGAGDPADCEDCQHVVDVWDDPHGALMSLSAAATHDGDVLGVAPGSRLVAASRKMSYANDLMTDLTLADALWWMAGGDPEWCRDDTNYCCDCGNNSDDPVDGCADPAACTDSGGSAPADLPGPLAPEQSAEVINLSFNWPDSSTPDCTSSGSTTCAKVCGSGATDCGIVEAVLDRIYAPQPGDDVNHGIHGTLPVTAAGVEEDPSSGIVYHHLKDLASTVAAGAVRTDGTAKANNKPINARGNFMDVVAATGGDDETDLCASCGLATGRSSAASAVTSGVAVMMLRQNPDLTPAQLHCLLRETADPDELWDSSSPDPGGEAECKFDGAHSVCMGRGMVDACAGVHAALDCKTGCCICDEDGNVVECPSLAIPVAIFEGELRMLFKSEGDFTIPEIAWTLVDCFNEGRLCHCVLNPGDCFRVEVKSPLEIEVFDIHAEVCIETRCWELPDRFKAWKPEEAIELRLDLDREALLWKRYSGAAAVLKFYSRGKPLQLSAGQLEVAPAD